VSPLQGRRVLVTGAARGIGAAVARELAARGGRVALVGLEADRLASLAEELGAPHTWAEADVTDQAALERAVERAVDVLGGLDVVVANAGVANTGTVATSPADALARVVEVNLIGAMRTVSTTLPHVLASGGHYLLVASVASFTVTPGLAAYGASKAGVQAFGDAVRLEVAHRGVTVGTAHPIWVDTDLVRDAKEDLPLFERSLQRMPGPLSLQLDVQTCARYLVDGIEQRRDKVFVPPSIGWIYHARALLGTWPVRRVMAKEAARSVPLMEEQVRRLGRSFGRHSIAMPPK
jgi:NAD(P)-dependent dehydrogenase (short-subunit alcohol dehydrogenase family)